MKNHIQSLLDRCICALKQEYSLDDNILKNIKIDRTKDKNHGDFATNIAMLLAKSMRKKPLEIAQIIIDKIESSDKIAKIEIAPPGFINFYLSKDYLSKSLKHMLNDDRLCVAKVKQPLNIVVDYSAPNVAKEMAVHHIRSTVIGDSVVRVLEFLGHNVIRANHIGDWGTQFGMLIAYLELKEQEQGNNLNLSDFEAFYRDAKALYDQDEAFAVKARAYVVKLQGGDKYCYDMWQKLVHMTMQQNQAIYDRLDVTLTQKDIMGESLYNDMLPGIVQDLEAKGLAVVDDGAVVVYLNEFKNKEGNPLGVIIRKQDGGYLYATTDLACVKYRVEKLKADAILYFIDSRQHQHLEATWTIARKANYAPANVKIEHEAFGMMLGRDGKPFKTRTGGTVKLKDLLDEAEHRVAKMLEQRQASYPEDIKAQIIHNIAIGAVKYADLSKNRLTDYIFDWDLMLSFDGNTAPYLQYAYSRIASIFRKANCELDYTITISNEYEEELGNKLLAFADVVNNVANKAMPHLLCTYLFELAGLFMRFYEACPVLKEGVSEQDKQSRLALCALTMRTLKQGLALLGINVMEQM